MTEHKNFLELLGINDVQYHVIAVVGGGGKTSLIYRLAEEILRLDQKVIITTTTHMAYEPELPFALHGDRGKIEDSLEQYGYVIAAEYEKEMDKFASLSKEKLESLRDYEAVVIIEADGAKKKPVKVPEVWEPVIPDFTELVIGVIGLDCLFRPISESSHRAEKMASFLGKGLNEVFLPEDLVKIASSFSGLRKGTEGKIYRVYLNKSDTLRCEENALEIVKSLKKQTIEAVYGSLKEAE